MLFQALVRIKALQEHCVAKEEVVDHVRKHNATLMNEQGQYKEAMRTLNQEVKELKEKLEEADRQKQKLQKEVTTLRKKVETAEIDTVQKFKTSQLFIDSCADYYGTGFDDCLKQVTLVLPELDLFEISMDAPEPVTPARNVITDDDDGIPTSQLLSKVDSGIVLAQRAVTPPSAPVSKTPVVAVDANDTQSQKDGGTIVNALNA